MQTDFPMEVLFRLVSEGTTHSDTQPNSSPVFFSARTMGTVQQGVPVEDMFVGHHEAQGEQCYRFSTVRLSLCIICVYSNSGLVPVSHHPQ